MEDNHAGDLLHEVTRSTAVFVEIHSLIAAAAAAVYIGENNSDDNLQETATEILSMPQSCDRLHPSVVLALKALGTAEPGSSHTRRSILQSLFLLPERLVGCAS